MIRNRLTFLWLRRPPNAVLTLLRIIPTPLP